MVQDDLRLSNTKVPGLGDLPLIGRAFRSDGKERNKNNLLIFITPTIVQDSDFRLTKTEFLKSPINTTEDKDWSAWDTGKPYDWSKLKPGKKDALNE
jgi:type II secretory pathway component GspD/PulD (secretin)